MNTTATTDDLTIDELKASIADLRSQEKAVLRDGIESAEKVLHMVKVLLAKITAMHDGLTKIENDLAEAY